MTCSLCYPHPCPDDPDEGQCRSADALAVLAERRAVYVRRGQRALLKLLLATGKASADDVQDAVTLPSGIDPTCLRAVPAALTRAGIITEAGFLLTCRTTAIARRVTTWALVDRAAVVRWLADHPDLPDPGERRQTPA